MSAPADDYHDSGLRPASGLRTWLTVPAGSDFSVQNLPWGVCAFPDGAKHVATRVGNTVVSMRLLAESSAAENPFAAHADLAAAFATDSLNAFMALGKPRWRAARAALQALFAEGVSDAVKAYVSACTKDIKDVQVCLPAVIGDYTVG